MNNQLGFHGHLGGKSRGTPCTHVEQRIPKKKKGQVASEQYQEHEHEHEQK